MADLPVFVSRNPDEIMSESRAQLEAILGRELQPAQVEQLMLQFIVYRETLLIERFNAGMRQLLYQFSTAPVLDYVAGLVAVERLPAANAGCVARFTLVVGHGVVLIPAGTRVATSDNKMIFETPDDVAVPVGMDQVDILVTAQAEGKAGNGYGVGKVCKILDPLAFVSTVQNLDVTGGGSDEETDEQLRERIRLAPSQFSTAGSRGAYEYHAKSANAAITDVSISSPTPGTVLIVPLTESGETPQQVINDVYGVCSAEKVRPLTDTVIVAAAVRADYKITVNVTVLEDQDATAARTEILNVLNGYATGKRQKLGLDVVRSQILKIAKIESVYDVEVEEPATNVEISAGEYANCTAIIVNITGFAHG